MLLNYLPPSNKRTTSCLCLNGGLVSNVSNCIKLCCVRCSLKNISTTKHKRVLLCTLFGQVVGFQKTLLKVHSKGLLEAGIVVSQPWSLQYIQTKVKLQGEGNPRIRGLGQAGNQVQAHISEMSLPVGFTHCTTQGAEPYHELKHVQIRSPRKERVPKPTP